MEQVAKLKRTWKLATVLQIVQKIPENYCPCLYLSMGQIWWLTELWLKSCKKCIISSTNIHHVTDLVNQGMVEKTKTWISREHRLSSKHFYSRFPTKIQFLYCLFSLVTPWSSTMVDTKRKIFWILGMQIAVKCIFVFSLGF